MLINAMLIKKECTTTYFVKGFPKALVLANIVS